MLRFTILGIPVRVEPWFWITMVFLGGGTRIATRQDMIEVALFVLAGFISILVHELGHALTIRKFGQPTAISLVAFGGFASYPSGAFGRKQSFLVTAAGPIAQIILGLLALGVLRYLPMPEHSLLIVLLHSLIWISIVWAIFNCLPIYPLDGGQMLSAILGGTRSTIVHGVSMITAAAVGVLAFLYLGSWLFPAFMAYFVWMNWQAIQTTRGSD